MVTEQRIGKLMDLHEGHNQSFKVVANRLQELEKRIDSLMSAQEWGGEGKVGTSEKGRVSQLLDANIDLLRLSIDGADELGQALKTLWRLYLAAAGAQLPDWVIDVGDMTVLEDYGVSQILEVIKR